MMMIKIIHSSKNVSDKKKNGRKNRLCDLPPKR